MANEDLVDDRVYDVAIVGAGPVGLYLAQRLALLEHSVIVAERQASAYRLPRAVHFDHEVGRLLAQAGIGDQLRTMTEPVDAYHWRTVDGETLLAFDWPGQGPSGWPIGNMFCQPDLEDLLSEVVEASPLIALRRGHEVVHLASAPEGVHLTVRGPAAAPTRLRARFVVGCDGANSFVRECMGAPMTDLGFFFDWLVVDVIPNDARDWSPINLQICDPVRPTTAVSGGPGRRRFEFMRMPDEPVEDLEHPGKVWELLSGWGYHPENAELERSAVYTFQARWAESWYRDRVAIAGDAAHLMPPFAGQGLCSGIRDAANLAWKLDRVLTGLASDDLLHTYTTERLAHVRSAIEQSVALGNVICVVDPAAAAARDEAMLAAGPDPARVLPPVAPEKLGPGVLDRAGGPAVGTLAAQPVVRTPDGRTGLWDDVVGVGFAMVSPLALVDVLDPTRRAALAAAEVAWTQLIPPLGPPAVGQVADVHDVLLSHLAEAGHVAAAVRPDGYLYGAVSDVDDLPAFVDDLLRQLAGAAPVAGLTGS